MYLLHISFTRILAVFLNIFFPTLQVNQSERDNIESFCA